MAQITELTQDECRELARTRSVGRLALRTHDGLRIFPVNYALAGGDFVFRTLPYGAIADSAHGAEVAFEVDELDEEHHTGWSVVAAGTCHRIEDPGEVQAVRREGDPDPWADGSRVLYFRISATVLSGRRVGEPTPPGAAGAG